MNKTTTTCQICERIIKAPVGHAEWREKGVLHGAYTEVIAHHGYRRPYQEGWQTASCMGARHRPYEVACDAIQPCIDAIREYTEAQERNLKEWVTFPPEKFTPMPRYIGHKQNEVVRPEGFDAIKNQEQGSWGGGQRYEYAHAERCRSYKRSISEGKKDIERLEKRLADWKPNK